MIGLIGALIIGLIVGAIAKLIVPGKEPGGCLMTMAIGIGGSFLAFYIGRLLGWTSEHPGSDRCGHPPGHLSLTQTSQSLRVPSLGSSKRRLQPLPHYPRSKDSQKGHEGHKGNMKNCPGPTDFQFHPVS